jgi:hypothetical protein
MADASKQQPSFSRARKWGIGFHVVVIVVIVLAVVIMVNYLSREYFYRYHASAHNRLALSPRTYNFVGSLTNKVRITLYYDQKEPLYSTIADLLGEYQMANRRIVVETVDYIRDPGAAQRVKAAYQFGSASDRNLILFECEGRRTVVDGKALTKYILEHDPTNTEEPYRRKPTAFEGERAVTASLIKVTSSKFFKALALEGHGEHHFDSDDGLTGYKKFAGILVQNYVQVEGVTLLGTNPVPADCNLLIVAGPRQPISEVELEKIDQYLAQGGRMIALFNADSVGVQTGLERILAKWFVRLGNGVVKDPEQSTKGDDVVVSAFTTHPMVNPIIGFGLDLIRPRPVGSFQNSKNAGAEAPKVEGVAFSSPRAYIQEDPAQTRGQIPLIVTVEKGEIKGLVTERGTTRMVIAGDSLFLANNQIERGANSTFANSMVNWLLDRPQLLQGIGSSNVKEYRLMMTATQLQTAQWILLAGMPGAIMAIGLLVWLKRRR